MAPSGFGALAVPSRKLPAGMQSKPCSGCLCSLKAPDVTICCAYRVLHRPSPDAERCDEALVTWANRIRQYLGHKSMQQYMTQVDGIHDS